MSPDLPYHIPLAGITALILLYFTIRAWKFGVFHPLTTALSLAASVAAGFFTYDNIAPLLEKLGTSSSQGIILGCTAIIALLVFLFLRTCGHHLSANAYDPDGLSGKLFGGTIGALLSLLPAILVIAVVATGLRRVATIAELRYIDTCSTLYSTGRTIYPDTPYFVKLGGALESIPRSTLFLDRVDPSCQTAKRHLVGLGLISRNYDLYLSIGTGHAGANEIYADPRVTRLLEALPVTKLLDARNHEGALADTSVQKTAELPDLADKLEEIDVIDTLHQALGVN